MELTSNLKNTAALVAIAGGEFGTRAHLAIARRKANGELATTTVTLCELRVPTGVEVVDGVPVCGACHEAAVEAELFSA
jgi:hypothetical protein